MMFLTHLERDQRRHLCLSEDLLKGEKAVSTLALGIALWKAIIILILISKKANSWNVVAVVFVLRVRMARIVRRAKEEDVALYSERRKLWKMAMFYSPLIRIIGWCRIQIR